MFITDPNQLKSIQTLVSTPVVIMMQDGTEHIGILSEINGDRLVLNAQQAAVQSQRKAKTVKTRGKRTVKGSAAATPQAQFQEVIPQVPLPPLGPMIILKTNEVSMIAPLII